MSKLFGTFAILLLIVVLSPATTKADPVVITSGFFSVSGTVGGPTYSLAGLNFSAASPGGDEGNSTPQAMCFPCLSGATINAGGFFVGQSLGQGNAVVNGTLFSNVGFGGTFSFGSPDIVIPFSLSNLTLTLPFNFAGTLRGCPTNCLLNSPIFSVDLVGSGTATIELAFGVLDSQGRALFFFRSVTYQFEVPEPASILLLGSGLAALAAGWRRPRSRS